VGAGVGGGCRGRVIGVGVRGRGRE